MKIILKPHAEDSDMIQMIDHENPRILIAVFHVDCLFTKDNPEFYNRLDDGETLTVKLEIVDD